MNTDRRAVTISLASRLWARLAVILAVCCVNPLVCMHAPVPALLMAVQVFVPAGSSDVEAPAEAGNFAEAFDAEDSECDSSELALGTRYHLAPGELSAVVSFWHGRGVEPWRSSPDPRPGERS